ncbi:Smr/MutS family protein [Rhizorhapis sp.]|uniref:Smr/MutS family protein n=1 Tax=Rhizorhapis sp. TaxID=1968842 RepID=UPI002B493847|nr:Smr/MutS family protein [Rhizorhapis sp.]HKR16198.1 Smr/MutS family protein [Rhizorhapis sp.]
MPRRSLSPEERAAWNQLARSVRPLKRLPVKQLEQAQDGGKTPAAPFVPPPASLTTPPAAVQRAQQRRTPSDVLDSGWERRITRGQLAPELSIDLHGNSLAAAHQRLERFLAEAVARGARVLLVITGKSREDHPQQDRPGRGAIRAEIGHWLDRSAYAANIASIRNAHPRHGGAGALYIILRRKNR